jgi:fluoride exporter
VIYLLIAVGGAAGALSRYVVDDLVTRAAGGAFPLGTLVVNLTGSFVLGLLFALVIERSALPADLRAPVMIGFIGAYTTFSTWMLESMRLMEDGAWLLAAANLGGSVVLGMLAVFAGLAVGRAL